MPLAVAPINAAHQEEPEQPRQRESIVLVCEPSVVPISKQTSQESLQHSNAQNDPVQNGEHLNRELVGRVWLVQAQERLEEGEGAHGTECISTWQFFATSGCNHRLLCAKHIRGRHGKGKSGAG